MSFYKTKENITAWLDQHEVQNYNLVEDLTYGYVVNVASCVDLFNYNLTTIAVKFNHIAGSFNCSDNQLTSLEFCPKTVNGNFYCSNNQLTSLEFCPTTIGGSFYCQDNQLTSLEFCPKTVGGVFSCTNNQLTSLEFCPTTVGGDFFCNDNPTLKGVQKISDFSQILAFHKEILIKIEKQHINKQLKQVATFNNIDNVDNISNKILFKL